MKTCNYTVFENEHPGISFNKRSVGGLLLSANHGTTQKKLLVFPLFKNALRVTNGEFREFPVPNNLEEAIDIFISVCMHWLTKDFRYFSETFLT